MWRHASRDRRQRHVRAAVAGEYEVQRGDFRGFDGDLLRRALVAVDYHGDLVAASAELPLIPSLCVGHDRDFRNRRSARVERCGKDGRAFDGAAILIGDLSCDPFGVLPSG
jgi:hypothetical protein